MVGGRGDEAKATILGEESNRLTVHQQVELLKQSLLNQAAGRGGHVKDMGS